MMVSALYPRYITAHLKSALADTPVVCLLGPRQVGKTTLAQQLEPRRVYINFDDHSLLEAARQDPTGFVQGLPQQVILDEVQRVPELMPAIKASVDRQRKPGRFLLTGSANLLLLPRVRESLAGRVEVVHLNPLSELEKQNRKFSADRNLLADLLWGRIKPSIVGEQRVVDGVAEAVCSGGYPEPIGRTPGRARQWYRQYIDAVIQRDVKDIADVRDEAEMRRLLEILACRTATLLNVSSLATELGLRRETVERYTAILEQLFLIRRLPAWHRNTAKRLIKTPKIHVVDSGLAAALNRLQVADWKNQSSEFGALLESFVVQQLICQSTWFDSENKFSEAQFFHYRDKDQVEVDLVIEVGRQVWGVEIKRAASVQAKDAAGLARLALQAGKQFQGGILLYTGSNCLPLAVPGCYAVPMNRLWL